MKVVVVLVSCLMLAQFAAADVGPGGDAAAGQAKAAQCAACHNMDGNSTIAAYPTIAGQHANYLYKQLRNFKAQERQNAIMYAQVLSLSDTDFKNLAAYFSQQALKPMEAPAKADVALGERMYRLGNPKTGVAACSGCHGPNGAGNPAANFPRIAGQHPEYTASQLGMFASMQRANDAGQMMRNTAGKLSEAEIKAVSAYLAGLR